MEKILSFFLVRSLHQHLSGRAEIVNCPVFCFLFSAVNRVSTPIVRQYEPSPAYLSRVSAEKRRPQPKRMPDFDYNVKDDEDDDDDEEYDGNDDADGDDDEFIDVETVPNVTETRPSHNFEPERKRPRLIEPKPERRLIERWF